MTATQFSKKLMKKNEVINSSNILKNFWKCFNWKGFLELWSKSCLSIVFIFLFMALKRKIGGKLKDLSFCSNWEIETLFLISRLWGLLKFYLTSNEKNQWLYMIDLNFKWFRQILNVFDPLSDTRKSRSLSETIFQWNLHFFFEFISPSFSAR